MGVAGGGLNFGEEPREGVRREVEEEMGIDVVSVSDKSVYVWTNHIEGFRGIDWYYSIVLAYRVELEHCDFTPSEECVEAGFFDAKDLQTLDLYSQSMKLREVFKIGDFR